MSEPDRYSLAPRASNGCSSCSLRQRKYKSADRDIAFAGPDDIQVPRHGNSRIGPSAQYNLGVRDGCKVSEPNVHGDVSALPPAVILRHRVVDDTEEPLSNELSVLMHPRNVKLRLLTDV